MNKQQKNMIEQDIIKCKEMLNVFDSRTFYRTMLTKYQAFDDNLFITEKAKVINGSELNFSYEI